MIRILISIILAVILALPVNSQSKKLVRLVESWKVGTSSGLFNDFSQQEFNDFKNSGIDCLEFGAGAFRDKSDAECAEWISDIKKKADAAGLEVWSIHLPFSRVYDISTTNSADRENMIKECTRIMTLCSPLEPKKFVIHGSAEPISDEERPARLENSIASLKILTGEAKKLKVQIALECLPRTCLGNTADELLKMVNEVGNGLGICFDSNHLLKEKPEEFVAKAGKHITTVHMSDYDGIDERHWLPGLGVINWTKVVSELAKAGYKGPFMFEASRRRPAPDGTADPSKLTTSELFQSFKEIKAEYKKSLE